MSKEYTPKKEKGFSRFIKIIIAVVAVIALSFIEDVVEISTWESAEIKTNLDAYYNKLTKDCFIGEYYWDGNIENMTIVVPDKYENYKVKGLGGFFGRGAPIAFSVVMPDELLAEVESVSDEGDDFEATTYTFTVKLGNNIKKITNFSYECYYYDEDGNVEFRVKMHYECSPDNKWIYSKDGMLFDKKTNKFIAD